MCDLLSLSLFFFCLLQKNSAFTPPFAPFPLLIFAWPPLRTAAPTPTPTHKVEDKDSKTRKTSTQPS